MFHGAVLHFEKIIILYAKNLAKKALLNFPKIHFLADSMYPKPDLSLLY